MDTGGGRSVSRSKIVQGLVGHGKEFEFYFKWNGKLLKGFKQKREIFKFIFLRSLVTWRMDWRGVKRGSRRLFVVIQAGDDYVLGKKA